MLAKEFIRRVPFRGGIMRAALPVAKAMGNLYIENAKGKLEAISQPPTAIFRPRAHKIERPEVELSFIVPAYNVQDYVGHCVRSLLDQDTARSFEVILINDGSFDLTRERAVEAADGDKRLVVIDQENSGFSGARNTGIDCARGKYISFVDSDDFVDPGFTEACMRELEATCADYVTAGYTDVDEDGGQARKNPVRMGMGTAWGRVYRASVWDTVRFPEGFLFEDTVLPYLIFPRFKGCVVEDASYCYRHRKNSISRNGIKPKSLDTYWIVEALLNACGEYGIPFSAVEEEFLINACYTVAARRSQLESDWLPLLFSAFADLWEEQTIHDSSLFKRRKDLAEVAKALEGHKYQTWRLLGLIERAESL